MQHKGTRTIETERLVLRRFVPEDAQAMFDNWASDPEVTKYLTWPTHQSVDVSRWVLGQWCPEYEKPDYYQWAIVSKALGEPIGSIAVVHQDDRTDMAHVGYALGQKWWRQGIMTEAMHAVMDFLFDEVGVQRIEARHDPRNPNSGGVMKKCGMKYEGTHRRADWNNQGICDACYYALLADERKTP